MITDAGRRGVNLLYGRSRWGLVLPCHRGLGWPGHTERRGRKEGRVRVSTGRKNKNKDDERRIIGALGKLDQQVWCHNWSLPSMETIYAHKRASHGNRRKYDNCVVTTLMLILILISLYGLVDGIFYYFSIHTIMLSQRVRKYVRVNNSGEPGSQVNRSSLSPSSNETRPHRFWVVNSRRWSRTRQASTERIMRLVLHQNRCWAKNRHGGMWYWHSQQKEEGIVGLVMKS